MNDSSSTISSLIRSKDVRSLKEVLNTYSTFEVAELLANKTEFQTGQYRRGMPLP